MAHTREIVCEYYVCRGDCRLNKEADFYGHCQICSSYRARKGAKPARVDNRKKKLAKIQKKEKYI